MLLQPAKLLMIFSLMAVALHSHAVSPAGNEAITIYSDGVRLAGNLWRPADLSAGERRPGVLLIHGWGGTKSHLNEAYAPHFAAAGYVVMTFDYTGWGESDGKVIRTGIRPASGANAKTAQTYTTEVTELRQLVNPLDELDDIRAAFAYLATVPEVDASRLALWGSSLGGGLALAIAAEFPQQVKVLMTQVGAVNPQAGLADLDPANPLSASSMAKLRGAMARGNAPSFLSEAAPGLQGFPQWPDYVRYNPMVNVERLQAATLIIDAADEELFDIKANGAYLANRLKGQVSVQYKTIKGSHYDVYRNEGYKQALSLELAWLELHLPVKPARATAD